jgi:hypothetical protein
MDTNRLKQLRADTELKRDLWPDMRRRLDQQTIRVPLFDWALAAAFLVWAIAFPEGLLALLYHL